MKRNKVLAKTLPQIGNIYSAENYNKKNTNRSNLCFSEFFLNHSIDHLESIDFSLEVLDGIQICIIGTEKSVNYAKEGDRDVQLSIRDVQDQVYEVQLFDRDDQKSASEAQLIDIDAQEHVWGAQTFVSGVQESVGIHPELDCKVPGGRKRK